MPYIWYPIHPSFHPPNSQSLLSSGKFCHCQKDVAISCEFIIIHKKRLFYTATNLLFEGRSAWIVGANSFFISDNGQKNYRIASGMRIFYRMGCVTTGFCSSVAINSVVLPLIKVENEYGWLLLLLLRAVDVSNTSEMCIKVSLYPVLENLICIE